MTKFTPCPFCGTDHPDNPIETPAFLDPRGGFTVRCGHPGCRAEVRDMTPELALEKWNRRA